MSLVMSTSHRLLRTLSTRSSLYNSPSRNSSGSGGQVLCELTRDGQVAVLTLNSPTKLNALSEEMGDELTDHVMKLKENATLRCCVLTGAGKAFSAGGDLAFLMDRHNDTPANNIRV